MKQIAEDVSSTDEKVYEYVYVIETTKAFENVNRGKIWSTMYKSGLSDKFLRTMNSLQ